VGSAVGAGGRQPVVHLVGEAGDDGGPLEVHPGTAGIDLRRDVPLGELGTVASDRVGHDTEPRLINVSDELREDRAGELPVGATFDVIIVEATDVDGGYAIEAAITAGPRKGDVLELLAVGLGSSGDADNADEGWLLGLLGLPATVTVGVDGPELRL